MRRALLAASAIAVLSLLVLRQPSYDPTAWLIWGRQISHGTLSMQGGPSWKPLPVLFTTLFAFAGSGAAPLLWLVLARVGGLLAIPFAYRVTRRLGGGRTAGLLAAAGLALGTDYLFNVLRGDSEGLLVLAVYAALDLHLSGRRRAALAVGILAGLIRPEIWPLLAVYGVYLLRERHGRPATFALAAAGAVALLVAWFLPDYIATGDVLRGANRARHPVPGSPGQSAFPFGLTLVYATIFLPWPLYAGAVLATVRARREGDGTRVALAVAVVGLMVTVGALAEVGFTGNIRYLTLPMALVCVLGGLGLEGLRPRTVLLVLAGAALAVSAGIVVSGALRLAREERVFGRQLDAALAAAPRCGRLATTPFERQAVAYRLDRRPVDVWTHAVAPGTAFVRAGRTLPNAGVLPVRRRLPGWTIRSTCR